MKKLFATILLLVCLITGVLFTQNKTPHILENTADTTKSLSREGYELEQVILLSRHNIRSPLSGKGSVLATVTPHKWFEWSSNPSELSLRGGILETEMGQYFRKWLEKEKLFPENYRPEEGAVRIYANSKQRTIATAKYFTAGLLPVSETKIETHVDFDKMDSVFEPRLTFISPTYKADAEKQIMTIYSNDVNNLNYNLLTDVIDMQKSEKFNTAKFRSNDIEIILEMNKEPGIKGSLKTACSISDALVLQYFEESDPIKAAFGHNLTEKQWKEIADIKDIYGDVLFTAPLIALNVAHPLLLEIESELMNNNRKFTFLCGHDSNIGSVLAALKVNDYTLPGSIEKTPIGGKIVFCRWRSPDGERFISVDMVYQTTEQLKTAPILDAKRKPAVINLQFSDLSGTEFLYPEKDFMSLLAKSIAEYDEIIERYGAKNN